MSSNEQNKLIEEGNKEYLTSYNILNDLKAGSFYELLFNKLYNSYYDISKKVFIPSFSKKSSIFNELTIPLQVFLKVDSYNLDDDYVLIEVKGNIDRQNFDDKIVKELFRTNYRFIKEPVKRYVYEYFAVYEISLQTGKLLSAKHGVYEAINSCLEVDNSCEIDVVDEI